MSNIAMRCAHGAICARSLECEHSDSTSLDYVASGSTGRAVSSSRLNGATTKRGNRNELLQNVQTAQKKRLLVENIKF